MSLLTTPTASLAKLAKDSGQKPNSTTEGEEKLGTVKLFIGAEVPEGWTLCDGRLLCISHYPALFAALGTTYGGDGERTFALPKLCEDATVAPASQSPPAFLGAMKVAGAPAASHAVAELRLVHHCRKGKLVALRA